MRASATLAVLGALATVGMGAPGAADAERVTVVRGGEASVVDTARRSSGVTVERGDIPEAAEPEARGAYAFPPASDWQLVGGRVVWLYNAREDLLVGCRLVGTAMVGRYNRRVKCTAPRHAPTFDGFYY